MKYAGVFEVRTNGIVITYKLKRWNDVFKRYEWTTGEDGAPPVLTFRTDERVLKFRLAPDAALEIALARHGLERM